MSELQQVLDSSAQLKLDVDTRMDKLDIKIGVAELMYDIAIGETNISQNWS